MLSADVMTKVALIVPIIMALSQLIKSLGLSAKLIPIVNIVMGVIAAYFYVAPSDIKLAAMVGIVAGLSASGLYSGVKNTSEQFKQ